MTFFDFAGAWSAHGPAGKAPKQRGKLWKRAAAAVLTAAAMAVLAGCVTDQEGDKVRDLEFSVVGTDQMPQELFTMVEEKKTEPFKLTYLDDQNLYIVVGYGEQPTGGYSITVPELYLTENSIVIKTDFLGPKKGEKAGEGPSYPFVAVMTEPSDSPVVFK